jgi:hypothetical protein
MPEKKPKVIRKKRGSEPSADVPIDPIEARFLLLERRLSKVEALLDPDPYAAFQALLRLDPTADMEEPQSLWYGSYEIYGETVPKPEIQKQAPQHGASYRIKPLEFPHRRDRMVYLVESRWPDLERILSKEYGSPRELKRTLLLHFPEWKSIPFRFLRGVGNRLWEYLGATKYVKPRKLAYAMTGCPELTWRSSLDRCESKEPSKLPIHFNAMGEHIKDRHRKWYSRLLKEGVTPKTLNMHPEGCGDCERFVMRPDRIMAAVNIQASLPNAGGGPGLSKLLA